MNHSSLPTTDFRADTEYPYPSFTVHEKYDNVEVQFADNAHARATHLIGIVESGKHEEQVVRDFVGHADIDEKGRVVRLDLDNVGPHFTQFCWMLYEGQTWMAIGYPHLQLPATVLDSGKPTMLDSVMVSTDETGRLVALMARVTTGACLPCLAN